MRLTIEERKRRKALVEQLLQEGFSLPGNRGGSKRSALEEAGSRDGMRTGGYAKWILSELAERASGRPDFEPNWLVAAVLGDDSVTAEDVAEGAVDDALSEVEERRERHDAGFWKKRAKDLGKDLAKVELALEEVSGIRSLDVQPATWLYTPYSSGPRNRSVVSMLFTDLHMGEVVDEDEILGLNAFNPVIAANRAQRFFDAACEIGPRWGSDTNIQGLLLMLGGDLISGDIHEELRITNGLTSHEQVREAVAVITAGIRQALTVYPFVHVASVPGNHSRTTIKSTAKLYARLSYDTLIAQMVADQFRDDTRVTFQIGSAPDAIIPILGYTVFLTHGDKMGTGGGQGFAGPMLPIVRGTKKVEAQQARAGRKPDVICHGHYHHSGNPGNVFSNGAFPGYSEYGNGLRAGLEAPQQWLFLMHETWGVRERAEIKLETPAPPKKQVVRIPAVMAYRD